MASRGKTVQIRRYIFDNLAEHPGDIASLVMGRFRISRQAANSHLKELESSGAIQSTGRTRGKQYQLNPIANFSTTKVVAGLEEHVPWQTEVKPLLEGMRENVVQICSYGFTEMLNNVIDHSQSDSVVFTVLRTHDSIDIKVIDWGVGIFRKIKQELNLPDELEAIKQLVKGKLTTDKAKHTGEGIFFTSRMFDCFSVLSGSLYFAHVRQDDDWLIEDQESPFNGTFIRMTISANSTLKTKDVFDSYCVDDDVYSFSKTNVPVSLLQYGTDNLVSRSQAKRLIGRFDMFREVLLDFSGVESIGQAFADELFRVFANEHPDVRLIPIRANENVLNMISRATGQKYDPHQQRLF